MPWWGWLLVGGGSMFAVCLVVALCWLLAFARSFW